MSNLDDYLEEREMNRVYDASREIALAESKTPTRSPSELWNALSWGARLTLIEGSDLDTGRRGDVIYTLAWEMLYAGERMQITAMLREN